MPIRIRQQKVRGNLVFQEGPHILLLHPIFSTDLYEVLILRHGVVLLFGIHHVNGRNKLQLLRSKALANTAQLSANLRFQRIDFIFGIILKALLFVKQTCKDLVDALLAVWAVVPFD